MGFPRQGYSSGFPFSSLEDPPDLWIKAAASALAHRLFTTELPQKPFHQMTKHDLCVTITGKFGLGVLWSRAEANSLPWEGRGTHPYSRHPLPTARDTAHMWTSPNGQHQLRLIPLSAAEDREALYRSKNKTRSWLWLTSWTPYWQIQT